CAAHDYGTDFGPLHAW
nr:immunoglobulin heavy chain junction region [Macaca mulatta]MOW98323.1 immunoglobulin heavy chain junction region [Macaca mulatta]MOW98360.1 immunoglobulin heavy chain junction region [Macaca mulatta]MOW98668.1 immunoglobulin heavy chain junction region [Macaca mulatta]MOW98968.1 immunoglobulin heavy chain junction region [Macaca mulatta]